MRMCVCVADATLFFVAALADAAVLLLHIIKTRAAITSYGLVGSR